MLVFDVGGCAKRNERPLGMLNAEARATVQRQALRVSSIPAVRSIVNLVRLCLQPSDSMRIFRIEFVRTAGCAIVEGMAWKTVEVIFRDSHDSQEWTCGYCRKVATTIRQGVAVCAQHKDLWTVGELRPPDPREASANH